MNRFLPRFLYLIHTIYALWIPFPLDPYLLPSSSPPPPSPQKNGGYTHDPFSQPQAFPQSGSGYGQGGFPGGVQSTGASGGTTHKAAGADDPFGGLF